MVQGNNDKSPAGQTAGRIDKNVYILGAGFSAAAGAPLIADFLDRAREFYDNPTSGLDEEIRGHFQRVFEFRNRLSAAREKMRFDLDNLEQFFGLVEISQRLSPETDKLRLPTKYLIVKTLELAIAKTKRSGHYEVPTTRSTEAWSSVLPDTFSKRSDSSPTIYSVGLYDLFAALVAGKLEDPQRRSRISDAVITFNYDLVLDHALARAGVVPEYALETRERSTESVPILKLHGSANWLTCPNCNRVQTLEIKLTEYPGLGRLPSCDCGATFEPLLVPPSWDKNDHQRELQNVWRRALAELEQASRVCIIGYSFPEVDAAFRNLLVVAFARNPALYKLILVDPDDAVENRLKKLLDDVFQARRFRSMKSHLHSAIAQGAFFSELGRGEIAGGRPLSSY